MSSEKMHSVTYGNTTYYFKTMKKLKAFVEKTANAHAARTPAHITSDDLIGAAWVGVLEAEQKYDESKGTKFTTFARHRQSKPPRLPDAPTLHTVRRTRRRAAARPPTT